uniref:Putative adaptor protein phosphotyrosine interaction ph domain and leucine zipper n=1 Tax=Ixodes ricinus TaxID=34613 RepID=A0A0K8RKK8_IXORI
MQGPEALHLADALDDNPQTRSLVNLFEQDAHQLHKYVKVMYEHANRIWNAERELADATTSLAHHVRQYDTQDFPLDMDPESILRTTLKQLSNTLQEMSSWHHMCSAQIGDSMVYPLSRFIESDLHEIFKLQEQYSSAAAEKEQALSRYCRQSRKRDTDRQKLDISEEVYLANKKFHTLSLKFYAYLNALQYRRKIALIEPLLGYVHSMKSFFGIAYETTHSADQDDFLANIGTSVGEGPEGDVVGRTCWVTSRSAGTGKGRERGPVPLPTRRRRTDGTDYLTLYVSGPDVVPRDPPEPGPGTVRT